LARLRGRLLDGVPGLVGELAEVHLPAVGGLREHPDVGARAEDALLAGGDNDGADFRVLEAQPLDRIVQLDVDAEIVGIELPLVARPEPAVLADVHGERRPRAGEAELPVPVAGRLGPEVDLDALGGLGHRGYPRMTQTPWAGFPPRSSQPCGTPPSRSALSPASRRWRSPL